MAHRVPSQPPLLPGFDYRYPLGTGGFADVFLYEQNLPRRQVAVKVLLANLVDAEVLRMFNAEADFMATLAAHPSILTVYTAGISSDGRPYLVMEYCQGSIVRRGPDGTSSPLPVARVLDVGVKLASALESAHRAGVLHRDIKPSNILLTSFGAPVLSDFGIATSVAAGHREQVFAMSVPWSSPEVLEEKTVGTVQSEVYALGATLYTLLAGRAPFEKPGKGENSLTKQRARILGEKPQVLPEATPEPVVDLLTRCLEKNPEARPQSMIEVARAIQSVQHQLELSPTAIEVAADEWAPTVAHIDTRDSSLRGVVVSSVPVESRRVRSKERAELRTTTRAVRDIDTPRLPNRMETGGSTVVIRAGEAREKQGFSVPALIGIVAGAVVVSVGATIGIIAMTVGL